MAVVQVRRAPAPAIQDRGAGDVQGVPAIAVECRDLHKSFAGSAVLCGVDLEIHAGAISVILGPSGTGKSVLLKHMIGLLAPDRGEVTVLGRPVSRMRRSELWALRRRIGILFQDGALFGSMSVYDNVAFPLRQHTDIPEAEIEEIVLRRLGEVGLGDAWALAPSELSGGMRKRVGFARALVLDPEVVLFDEPDSGLDPVRTALLCELIVETHARQGGTYVLITHDILSAKRVAHHIALLWRGQIVQSGAAADMWRSDDPFVRQFLSGESIGPLGMD
jgi:phospholipid/cholesterol/gamma-HCH transport system ATP-binding protein